MLWFQGLCECLWLKIIIWIKLILMKVRQQFVIINQSFSSITYFLFILFFHYSPTQNISVSFFHPSFIFLSSFFPSSTSLHPSHLPTFSFHLHPPIAPSFFSPSSYSYFFLSFFHLSPILSSFLKFSILLFFLNYFLFIFHSSFSTPTTHLPNKIIPTWSSLSTFSPLPLLLHPFSLLLHPPSLIPTFPLIPTPSPPQPAIHRGTASRQYLGDEDARVFACVKINKNNI